MNMPTSLAPRTMGEALEFSKLIAQSSMVPAAYKGKPADVLVAVQWGAELGLAPLQALQNIATINGKPSVYGDAALALVRGSAVCEDVEEYVEGEGEAMVATCVAKRKGSKPVVARFSVADAKAAGLWRKVGPWTQYPRRMLQMRARGFALRDAFPDVLKGLITAEEAADYPRPQEKVINPLDQFAKQVVQEAQQEAPSPVRETIETPPADPVLEGEVITDAEPSPSSGSRIALLAPTGEIIEEIGDRAAWVQTYLEWMTKIAQSKKYAPRTKMTKLREFREANDKVLHQFPPQDRARIAGAYQGHLKMLGVQMAEEGGDAPADGQ